MLVMYLCIRDIDVDLVFVCYGYRCFRMYLCVRGIDVGHVFVC